MAASKTAVARASAVGSTSSEGGTLATAARTAEPSVIAASGPRCCFCFFLRGAADDAAADDDDDEAAAARPDDDGGLLDAAAEEGRTDDGTAADATADRRAVGARPGASSVRALPHCVPKKLPASPTATLAEVPRFKAECPSGLGPGLSGAGCASRAFCATFS